jgi:hypothetical protein
MKAPNITPGEWWAEDAAIWHSGGDIVAVTATHADKLGFDPRHLTENQKSNARLIAAAPQLAEALERLLRVASVELAETRPDVLERAKNTLLAAGYTE